LPIFTTTQSGSTTIKGVTGSTNSTAGFDPADKSANLFPFPFLLIKDK
jgi:hypothetical protein